MIKYLLDHTFANDMRVVVTEDGFTLWDSTAGRWVIDGSCLVDENVLYISKEHLSRAKKKWISHEHPSSLSQAPRTQTKESKMSVECKQCGAIVNDMTTLLKRHKCGQGQSLLYCDESTPFPPPKTREWWIKIEGVNGELRGVYTLSNRPHEDKGDEIIRVIEKSAYDAAKAEHARFAYNAGLRYGEIMLKCDAATAALEQSRAELTEEIQERQKWAKSAAQLLERNQTLEKEFRGITEINIETVSRVAEERDKARSEYNEAASNFTKLSELAARENRQLSEAKDKHLRLWYEYVRLRTQLKAMREGVSAFVEHDRVRGYATGIEWIKLIADARKLLE